MILKVHLAISALTRRKLSIASILRPLKGTYAAKKMIVTVCAPLKTMTLLAQINFKDCLSIKSASETHLSVEVSKYLL